MNTERKSLMEIAVERRIVVNKFWSTEKLAKEVNAGIVAKDRRSDAVRRGWDSRRTKYGQTGMPEGCAYRRLQSLRSVVL